MSSDTMQFQNITAGLFVSHMATARVKAHFLRLQNETAGLIDWYFVLNRGTHPNPSWDVDIESPETVMPARHAEMLQNGGVQGGYLDTVIFPCVLALPQQFVWVMEYDVDFSGHWRDFFSQFDRDNTDLLTTTITPRQTCPTWHWWRNARAPSTVDDQDWARAFHPVMRISKKMAALYCDTVADGAWSGHYEFTVPTVALATGCSLKDLSQKPNETAMSRPNYTNTPKSPQLSPGTFVWRPSRKAYFHEKGVTFVERNMLHHPIKTDADDWDNQRDKANDTPELCILFAHHKLDPLTLKHYELLKKHNSHHCIIPIADGTQEQLPDTVDVSAFDNHWRQTNGWRNCDTMLLRWFMNRSITAARYIFIEYDCLCTEDLAISYKKVWNADIAARDLFKPSHRRNTRRGQYVQENWPHFQEIKLLPPEDRRYAAGLVPFAGIFFSHKGLQAVIENAPKADVISELRIGTAARKAGLSIKEFPDSLKRRIRWDPHPYAPLTPGICHPIKGPSENRLQKISVVMATNNGARYLEEQLASLAEQTRLPDELIVLENTSTDRTDEILSKFSIEAPFPVKFIHDSKSKGPVGTLAEAIEQIDSDFLLFSGQNDIWNIQKIATLVDLAKAETCEVFTHDLKLIGNDNTAHPGSYFTLLENAGIPRAACIERSATAVKASFFKNWGLPSADNKTSYDIWIAMLSSLLDVRKYIDRPLASYRFDEGICSVWLPTHSNFQFINKHSTMSQFSDYEVILNLHVGDWNFSSISQIDRALIFAIENLADRELFLRARRILRTHAKYLKPNQVEKAVEQIRTRISSVDNIVRTLASVKFLK